MGFGHRVYKVRDPRAEVLSKVAEEMAAAQLEDRKLFDLARTVEQTALRVLDEHKPGRNLKTNVEFYTALVLQSLGLQPRSVRGDVRVRPRRRLVRARHRAARRGPPDPPAVGVRRTPGPAHRALRQVGQF